MSLKFLHFDNIGNRMFRKNGLVPTIGNRMFRKNGLVKDIIRKLYITGIITSYIDAVSLGS